MRCILRLILFLSSGVFLYSCQNGKEDPVVIVTTDPEFQVDLFEQRSAADGSPTFGLWIRSIEKYPCANYVLENEVQVAGADISVHLSSVYAPDTCTGTPAVAQAFVPIGNLPPGTYNLTLSLADAIENTAVLNVFENRYELTVPHPQGVDFQNLVVNKMPENLVWGYILTPDAAATERAGAFLADLKSITAEPTLPAGYYSYFSISGTGLISLHAGFAPASTVQVFVRRFASAPVDVQNLLQQYRSGPQNALQIGCLTTLGAF
ncbi:MAG TPA: hypothetical protein PLO67_10315 [Saprospiraceae bacterium]|nr:hypothetical protein [Saprospiraceae bacterium]HPI06352.1 hypothetical protein [Saprospiraceae bacterium]